VLDEQPEHNLSRRRRRSRGQRAADVFSAATQSS